MISFVNLSTGVVETPCNKSVVEQYKKRPDLYKEICDIVKENTPKTIPKKEKRKRR